MGDPLPDRPRASPCRATTHLKARPRQRARSTPELDLGLSEHDRPRHRDKINWPHARTSQPAQRHEPGTTPADPAPTTGHDQPTPASRSIGGSRLRAGLTSVRPAAGIGRWRTYRAQTGSAIAIRSRRARRSVSAESVFPRQLPTVPFLGTAEVGQRHRQGSVKYPKALTHRACLQPAPPPKRKLNGERSRPITAVNSRAVRFPVVSLGGGDLLVERVGVGLLVLDSVEVLSVDVGERGAVAGVAEEQVEHRPDE